MTLYFRFRFNIFHRDRRDPFHLFCTRKNDHLWTWLMYWRVHIEFSYSIILLYYQLSWSNIMFIVRQKVHYNSLGCIMIVLKISNKNKHICTFQFHTFRNLEMATHKILFERCVMIYVVWTRERERSIFRVIKTLDGAIYCFFYLYINFVLVVEPNDSFDCVVKSIDSVCLFIYHF